MPFLHSSARLAAARPSLSPRKIEKKRKSKEREGLAARLLLYCCRLHFKHVKEEIASKGRKIDQLECSDLFIVGPLP